MNKRGAGICLYMISMFVFALIVVSNFVLFTTHNWSSDDLMYIKLASFEKLCGGISVIFLMAGTFYIFSGEAEERKLKKTQQST